MQGNCLRALFGVVSLWAAGSAFASTTTIDFEGYQRGRIIDNEYTASPLPGLTVRAKNRSKGPDLAVIFDTNNPTGGDGDLGAPFDTFNPGLPDDYRPGNVLIIQERNDCSLRKGYCKVPDDEGSKPAGYFEFTFVDVVTLESLDFFDIEFNENHNSPDSQVRLFDIDNIEMTDFSFFVPYTGGDNTWDRLDFGSIHGVQRMIVELRGSGAIDNLRFSMPERVHAVPLLPTVLLYGSALGLIGFLRRSANS